MNRYLSFSLKFKFALVLLIGIFSFNGVSAQNQVIIPDANFAAWLQANYPNCMTGNLMDTTCVEIVSETMVNVNSLSIANLDGIQYFDGLDTLYCDYNQLATLPNLPSGLEYLSCNDNQLLSLPNLPNGLLRLYCINNQLTSLPNLPSGLLTLDCTNNQLSNLPNLPSSMISLSVNSNSLLSLPNLPIGLEGLGCSNNQLNSLPNLPNGLLTLSCDNNQLSSLPSLPMSIKTLFCKGNYLTSLPSLPTDLWIFFCDNNQLTSLPSLPTGLKVLRCSNNNISCLPTLPQTLTTLAIANTNVSCLPNHPPGLSFPLPICNGFCFCADYICTAGQFLAWNQNNNYWKHKLNGKADAGIYWNNRDSIASNSTSDGAFVLDADSIFNANGSYSTPLVNASLTSYNFYTGGISGDTVFISFRQYYRGDNSSTKVEYSFDSGNTWTSQLLNSDIDNGDETANYDYPIIPVLLPMVHDSLMIRFVYEGLGYFWIIDDIKLCSGYPSPTLPRPALGALLHARHYNYKIDKNGHPYVPNEMVAKLNPAFTIIADTLFMPTGDTLRRTNSCVCDTLQLYEILPGSLYGGYPSDTSGASTSIEEKIKGGKLVSHIHSGGANYYTFQELTSGSNCGTPASQPLTALPSYITPSTASTNIVAILDTGVDLPVTPPSGSPSIWDRLWASPTGTSAACGGMMGWNFVDKNNNPTDGHGHGTHVTGIINNTLNEHFPGACDIKFMPVKTHDNNGIGTLFNSACGVYYAASNGAKVINCSWGYYADSLQNAELLYDALRFASDRGAMIVAASGNDGINPISPNLHLPSGFTYIPTGVGLNELDNIIAVGSTNGAGVVSSFSNYSNTSVDVGVPGEGIVSNNLCGTTSSMTGTSMSCPVVSAAVAQAMACTPYSDSSFAAVQENVLSQCAFETGSGLFVSGLSILYSCCNSNLSILGADAVCNGDSIALTASSGFAGYQWSNGGDSSSVSVFNSDVYCVTATHATGCTVTDCKEIGDVLHESITISICEGNSYFGYTQAGIYIDTIQDMGCVTERTLNLTVNPLPEAVITVDSLFDSVVLTASGGSSYIWNTGQTGNSITAYQPSDYCVTVSNSNGCQDSTCFLFTDITSETNGIFGVSIIPNVASHYTNLIIFSSQSGTMEVSVYTSSGQVIAFWNVEVTSSPYSVPLDLSGYAEGVYVVRVKNQNDVVARRLVVVR